MLRYGVLGLLIERRGYGYELVQRLSARLGTAWQLNPSAVYTALDQLEDEGLIAAAAVAAPADVATSERRSSRRGPGRRVVYDATDLGLREFRAWLERPSERVDPIRSELALKVALACPDSVPSLLASIAHEERLILRSLKDECVPAEQGYRAERPRLVRLDGGERDGEDDPAVCPSANGRGGGSVAHPGGRGSGTGAHAPGAESHVHASTAWPSAAATLVSAAATTRLQGELTWLASVRETLQRMLAESVSAAAHPTVADTAPLR